MKSTVCNLAGMAVAVACCSMMINRPSVADEQPIVQKQAHVIVVQAKGDADDAASPEAVTATLHEKLEGLPEELQQKLRAKLEAFQKQHAGAVQVQGKKLVVSAREKEGDGQDGNAPQHVVMTLVPAEGKGEATVVKAQAIVLKDGDNTQTFTIKVEGDQAHVHGEPMTVVTHAEGAVEGKPLAKNVQVYTVRIDADGTAEAGKAVRWQVQGPEHKAAAVRLTKVAPAHADVVKRLAKIEAELKQIRKLLEELQQSEAE